MGMVTPLKPVRGSKLRCHYAKVKSGPGVGISDTGSGFLDFFSPIDLVRWIQEANAEGVSVVVLAIREL